MVVFLYVLHNQVEKQAQEAIAAKEAAEAEAKEKEASAARYAGRVGYISVVLLFLSFQAFC